MGRWSAAFVGGLGGTIDITSPVVVSSLTFLSGAWVLEGSGVTILPSPAGSPSPPAPLPAGEGSIDVAAGSATIACQISGTALVKTGCGILLLGAAFALPAQAAVEVDNGVLDLGRTTSEVSTVTLVSGSIIDGTISAGVAFDLESGTVLANLTGPAALNKQGQGTVVLAGANSYQGGTNALGGTLVAEMASSLPSAATGTGTVIVAPTLYWSGDGDWTTGQWQLAGGTPTTWVDGSSVVLAAGSNLTLSGLVNVGSINVQGDATITGGTLSLASGSIVVSSGTATIDSELDGSNLVKAGTGTLVLGGSLAYTGVTIVDGGTLDLLSPLAAAPVVASGQAIGPGAVFNANGTSLYSLDPAMFALVDSLFVDQSIDRADMIQILESAADGGAVSDGALDALEALTMPQNEAPAEHARLRGGACRRRGAGQSGQRHLSRPAAGKPGRAGHGPVAGHGLGRLGGQVVLRHGSSRGALACDL